MHKLHQWIAGFKPSSRLSPKTALIVVMSVMPLAGATMAYGQDGAPEVQKFRAAGKTKELLPARLNSGWVAVSPLRSFNKDQWKILPNEDIHNEYGLRTLFTRQYIDGRKRHTVEIFEMTYTSGAYGLFTFNRRSLPPNRKEFYVGRFMVSIAGDEPDPAVINELEDLLANDSGPIPILPTQLPSQNKIAASETYLTGPAALGRIEPFLHLKDIVDFTGGVQVATAAYDQTGGPMHIMIVEYNTPQSASAGVAMSKNHFDSLPSDEKQSRIVKRTGNYLIEVSDISNRPQAEQLIGQIKYSPRVTWEGTKFSNIPLRYRPPDPIGLEQASETAMMIIRTFYWIGILVTGSILTGIIAGSSFFYYRRYRRRKLGIDDIFSDLGETVRLNLDELLIEPGKEEIKQIRSGTE